MALVEKHKIGNTIIEIHDDAYRDKTKEDTERILKRITQIAVNAAYKKAAFKKEG